MVDINSIILIIPLNGYGIKTPIKQRRMSEWMKTKDPVTCCLEEITLNIKTHID